MLHRVLILIVTICLPTLLPSLAPAQTMPQQLRVIDTPSDGGGSLTVLWASSPNDSATSKYQILVHEGGLPQDPAAWKVRATGAASAGRS